MSGRRSRSRKKRNQGTGRPASSPPARRDPDQIVERSSEESPATAPIPPPEVVAEQLKYTHHIEFSTGPLPQPETLGGYEGIVPGAAERIIRMAENQLSHRHDQELARLHADIKLEGRGQWMAFVVALVALVGGMVLLAFDKSVAGLATMSVRLRVSSGSWSRPGGARRAFPAQARPVTSRNRIHTLQLLSNRVG